MLKIVVQIFGKCKTMLYICDIFKQQCFIGLFK